ncbi:MULTISPECIES: DUF4097 family beta strand repeat-containing protein [unclassified Microbacterium]|uniref:DUF4097 family beta strand repeat-containing protein n=1 Tax=unclassified Microbacterium TaxID=2609290 RepID=UPI0038680E74
MTLEKWLVQPGETRVIDLDGIHKLKVGLVGGQIDVVGHDEPGVRIEVHAVTAKELRIEANDGAIEINHAQLRWDNFLDVFRNFGSGGPQAEISIAVPRSVALTLGVVSASALVAGLEADAKLNTVSGDVIVDGLTGDVTAHTVSGDVQIRALTGTVGANSVSGDITATGTIRTASIDTVGGAALIDSTGPVQSVSFNTVGGGVTVRLDDHLPTKFALRTVSGALRVDGVDRAERSIGSTYSGSVGELSGSFADIRANTVSGDVTVVRRAALTAADGDAPTPEEW